jgi:hypothetical protein
MALLKKLHTSGQQPLSFGGKSRPGRVPSARTPTRGAAIAAALDGGMPPKKRPQPHHGHSAADHRGHSEPSTSGKRSVLLPLESGQAQDLALWSPALS